MRYSRGRGRLGQTQRQLLADSGWVQSVEFAGFYRDPCSGKLFTKAFAATIQQVRNRAARKAERMRLPHAS